MTVLEVSTAQNLITVDQFEQMLALPENRDRLLELINGEIVEKMPTEEHGLLSGNIVTGLNNFVKPQRLGRVGTEVRHRRADDALNTRLPDISFTSTKRPLVTRGSVPHFPDLAVEIKSPDDSVRQLREKAEFYLANGVAVVWLVYPEQRMVEIYSLDGDVEILLEGDIVTGGEVLPGFSMPVTDIFDDPLAE
jgi:Uma2 family endonuclease